MVEKCLLLGGDVLESVELRGKAVLLILIHIPLTIFPGPHLCQLVLIFLQEDILIMTNNRCHLIRQWVEKILGDLRVPGNRLLSRYPHK